MAYTKTITLGNQTGGPIPTKISFFSQGALFTLNGVSNQEPGSRLDGEIISVTTGKDLGSPTGNFTITLHNRPIQQPGPLKGRYLSDVIGANDMVVISFRRGADPMLGAMIGVVAHAPTDIESVGAGGAKVNHVSITGFDLGKLLINAMIYYFKDIPLADLTKFAMRGWDFLGTSGQFPAGTKAAITKAVLEAFFYTMSSLSYKRREGQKSDVRNVLSYRLGKTFGLIPVGPSFVEQEQSVFAFLQGITEKPWCELFVETAIDDQGFLNAMIPSPEINSDTADPIDGARSVLFMRETPFDKDAWEALPLFEIDDTVVIEATIGGEPTIYNVFYARASGLGANDPQTNMSITGVALFNDVSALRHGYKPLVSDSRVFPIYVDQGTVEELKAVALRLTKQLYRWFAPSPDFRSGSITVQGNPAYKIGTRLRRTYLGRATALVQEFYIEGVSHSWEAFGGYRTTLRVTRGLPTTANRFPDPPAAFTAASYAADVPYPFRQ